MMETIEQQADDIPRKSSTQQKSEKQDTQNAADEITEIKETIQRKDFQKMLSLAETDLENVQEANHEALQTLFESVGDKYI